MLKIQTILVLVIVTFLILRVVLEGLVEKAGMHMEEIMEEKAEMEG